MRNCIAILFILQSIFTIGQVTNPKIESLKLENKVIHSKLDGKPITMYLEFQQFSTFSLYLYSTSGWYYLENKKDEKLPIIGFHTPEKILIYEIEDSLMREKLLNFIIDNDNYFSELNYYTEFKNYKAKFEITKHSQYWKKADKKLAFSAGLKDFEIQKSLTNLVLNETANFNLTSVLPPFSSSEILASTNKKVLVKYVYTPGRNVMGMCGAGEEVVLLLLKFDSHLNLLSEEHILIGSCYFNLDFEQSKNDDGKLLFSVSDWEKNDTYLYTFFLDSLEYLKE